ncbi:MAG: hypothetical protein JO271_00505 [Verrucomicrobia bacterium]|nr:hypothetical protein [Verrucomicrobiota bacterium]MBV9273558.1 hypothetical protein [Verrucomicrobiota bacterium]
MASVTLSDCDYGVGVNRLKLDETNPGASMSKRVQMRLPKHLEGSRFVGDKLYLLQAGGSLA